MNTRHNVLCYLIFSTLIVSQQVLSSPITIELSAPQQAGTFEWYQDGSNRNVVRYLYPKDIDGDGIDEVFIAGFETQPNSPEEYSNTSVHIFGWSGGNFQEITSVWLPDGAHQVEGVGDIDFGDFNGDELIDVFLTSYVDMDFCECLTVNSYALINQGGYFVKQILGQGTWEHGAFAADLNQDGYQDIFATGYEHPVSVYMGSAEGLTKVAISGVDASGLSHNSHEGYGSGVAVADFLGDGSVSAVVVDAAVNGGGTRLIKVMLDLNNTPSAFDFIADLPAPILTLPEWESATAGDSHDVRAEPFDFNSDGLMDVVVFSRAGNSGNGWPRISATQFLENRGSGVFDDVTNSVLSNYDHQSGAPYNPIVADFNGDGLLDLFLSEVDFESPHNSTTLLMQHDGLFVDTGRSQFSPLLSSVPYSDSIGTIARGPDSQYYFVWDTHSWQQLAAVSYARVDFDTDGDGILDSVDLYPQDPRYSSDSDSDGLPDEWEDANFGSTLAADGTDESDFDNDGYSDAIEFGNGSDPTVGDPIEIEYTIHNGWNLLSIRQDLGEEGISLLDTALQDAGMTLHSIWRFQTDSGRWYYNKMIADALTGTITPPLSTTAGYWLNVEHDGSRTDVTINGVRNMDDPLLETGWNLVGVPQTISNLAEYSAANEIESIWTYTQGGWSAYSEGHAGGGTLTTMEPGVGYWVKVTAP